MRGGGGVSKENDVLCLMTKHKHKNKLMSEQLYTQRNNSVYNVICRHICKNFDVQFQIICGNMNQKYSLKIWKYLLLTYDLMIPSSVNMGNKAL